ncbi:MAG: LysE family translocator [Cohaesibacter sp.]|nr:LysE family translocator [Cohaesibacter sp.]
MTDAMVTIFAAWSALAAAALSPGPNMVAVASRGLGSGRGSALLVAFGIALGGFGWAMLTALGLGTLFEAFPVLLRVLGLVGGLYLGWLGYKGWRAAITGGSGEIAPQTGEGLWRDVRYGLVVTATNPKVALLWASLSTFVGGQTTSLSLLLLFACGSSFILFAIYGGYGLLFSVGGIRQLYVRFQKTSEAVFGTIFGLIGIGMIIRSVRAGL